MEYQKSNRTPQISPETTPNPQVTSSQATTLPPTPNIPPVWLNFPITDDPLIQSLIMKESQNDDSRIGDLGLTNKAYGCLQIRLGVVTDVNNLYDTNFTPQAMLNNRLLSIYVCKAYWKIWATRERIGHEPTWEDKARIWNAGPNGWKNEEDYEVLTEKDKNRVALAKLYWSDILKYYPPKKVA